jgi:Calcineurin-like phosphoesterase
MITIAPIYVVGDIHGYLRVLHRILREAHLIDTAHHWIGGSALLWFVGDLVDRGPDSVAVLDFVMALQQEAVAVGGAVDSLLGNHELQMLAAYQFGRRSLGLRSNFYTRWRQNGGVKKDLSKLRAEHIAWLTERPLMALVENALLIHADAPLYTRYGRSVAEVNATFQTILTHSNTLAWEEAIGVFAMRDVFMHPASGREFVERFLQIFGGTMIIHGHSPISVVVDRPVRKVEQPYVYVDGKCINVDGGIYLGGSGFVYQIPNCTVKQQIG